MHAKRQNERDFFHHGASNSMRRPQYQVGVDITPYDLYPIQGLSSSPDFSDQYSSRDRLPYHLYDTSADCCALQSSFVAQDGTQCDISAGGLQNLHYPDNLYCSFCESGQAHSACQVQLGSFRNSFLEAPSIAWVIVYRKTIRIEAQILSTSRGPNWVASPRLEWKPDQYVLVTTGLCHRIYHPMTRKQVFKRPKSTASSFSIRYRYAIRR